MTRDEGRNEPQPLGREMHLRPGADQVCTKTAALPPSQGWLGGGEWGPGRKGTHFLGKAHAGLSFWKGGCLRDPDAGACRGRVTQKAVQLHSSHCRRHGHPLEIRAVWLGKAVLSQSSSTHTGEVGANTWRRGCRRLCGIGGCAHLNI